MVDLEHLVWVLRAADQLHAGHVAGGASTANHWTGATDVVAEQDIVVLPDLEMTHLQNAVI